VATYAMSGGIFSNHFTANLPRNLPVNFFFENRLRFDEIMAMSLWSRFFGPPCIGQLVPGPGDLLAVNFNSRRLQ